MSSSVFQVGLSVVFACVGALLLVLTTYNGSGRVIRGLGSTSAWRVYRRSLAVCSGVAFLLSVWCMFSAVRIDGPTRVPSPFATAHKALELMVDGTLPREVAISAGRIVIGFILACTIGTGVGWIAGSFVIAGQLILPSNSFVRYIPPTAFVALMVVYLGVGELYKIGVVFISVVFFIIQMTVDVVEDVDQRYLEMGLVSGMSEWQVFRLVVVPATLPRVVDVWRINLSGAWTFLVAAEIVGAKGGLGHLIAISQRFGRIEELFVAILSFGLIGLISDYVIGQFSRWIFKWQK